MSLPDESINHRVGAPPAKVSGALSSWGNLTAATHRNKKPGHAEWNPGLQPLEKGGSGNLLHSDKSRMRRHWSAHVEHGGDNTVFYSPWFSDLPANHMSGVLPLSNVLQRCIFGRMGEGARRTHPQASCRTMDDESHHPSLLRTPPQTLA
ncbi:hypothetical protein BDV18DRAFT_50980 [Aspergillus unguis]